MASPHREHGHCIAKGGDLGAMMAEIYGRRDGLCRGRGGSMHIADLSKGMLCANAIVGGAPSLATDAALSARTLGTCGLAIWGAEDPIVSIDALAKMPAAVAKLEVAGVGHMPHLERAELVNDAILAHLRRHGVPASLLELGS